MRQMAAVGSRLMGMMAVDESNALYQSFRSKTTMGLEIGSLVAGGYGAVKGVIGFTKLARMPVQISKMTSNAKIIKAGQIWSSTKKRTPVKNAFRHWKDHGQEFSELLNSKQYVEQAHNFFTRRDQLLTKVRPNGEILLYDADANIFGVFTNEGVPKTMFKPIDGILYWERN